MSYKTYWNPNIGSGDSSNGLIPETENRFIQSPITENANGSIQQVNSLNVLQPVDSNNPSYIGYTGDSVNMAEIIGGSAFTIFMVYSALGDLLNILNGNDEGLVIGEYSGVGVEVDYTNASSGLSVICHDTSQNETYKFIAVTYEDSAKVLTLYAKGQVNSYSNPGFTIPDLSLTTNQIGIYTAMPEPMTGLLLEMGFYDRILTADEINGIASFEANKFGFNAVKF